MARSILLSIAPISVSALLLVAGCRTANPGEFRDAELREPGFAISEAPPAGPRATQVSEAASLRHTAPALQNTGAVGPSEAEQEPVAFARPDPERTAGIVVHGSDDADWWLRLRLPVSFGLTDVDIGRDLSVELETTTTISVVPTLEGAIVLDRRWTLVPYAGFGAAYQYEGGQLAGDDPWVWLARGGLRAHYWKPFGERYAVLTKGEVRYDSVLGEGQGALGDLGSIDAAVEVRRVLGEPGLKTHLQPGVYLQALHFFQNDDLRVDGVSAQAIEDQLELGMSFGTSEPASIGWIPLPRIFVGAFIGEEQRGLRIRVGQL